MSPLAVRRLRSLSDTEFYPQRAASTSALLRDKTIFYSLLSRGARIKK